MLNDTPRALKAAMSATGDHGGSRYRSHYSTTQAEAAKQYDVKLRSLARAAHIFRFGIPDLVSLVAEDRLSLKAAEDISRMTPADQTKAVRDINARSFMMPTGNVPRADRTS